MHDSVPLPSPPLPYFSSCPCPIPHLPVEFCTLRHSGGSQGMSLGDEAPTRVDHPASPVRHLSFVNQPTSLALLTQPLYTYENYTQWSFME